MNRSHGFGFKASVYVIDCKGPLPHDITFSTVTILHFPKQTSIISECLHSDSSMALNACTLFDSPFPSFFWQRFRIVVLSEHPNFSGVHNTASRRYSCTLYHGWLTRMTVAQWMAVKMGSCRRREALHCLELPISGGAQSFVSMVLV